MLAVSGLDSPSLLPPLPLTPPLQVGTSMCVRYSLSCLCPSQAYANKQGLDRKTLSFLFDGRRIPEGAMASDLDLEEGDL